jgi:hypothetical protein
MNICGTGMKGNVNWDDLQHKTSFNSMKVMMHGSRLNDLSAVAFTQNDISSRIKYILYNPMAVQTPGMMEFGGSTMKFVYKIIGKPVEKDIVPMLELLAYPPEPTFSAYKERKRLDTGSVTYDTENARQLYTITVKLLEDMNETKY